LNFNRPRGSAESLLHYHAPGCAAALLLVALIAGLVFGVSS
jgi:hypothetical protein